MADLTSIVTYTPVIVLLQAVLGIVLLLLALKTAKGFLKFVFVVLALAALAGAAFKAFYDLHKSGGLAADMRLPFAVGVAVSAIAGFIVIAFFLWGVGIPVQVSPPIIGYVDPASPESSSRGRPSTRRPHPHRHPRQGLRSRSGAHPLLQARQIARQTPTDRPTAAQRQNLEEPCTPPT